MKSAHAMTEDPHGPYMASIPPAQRPLLRSIQSIVEEAVPTGKRCISYRMPAYCDGRVFIYFAAFKHHIGVYPPVTAEAALIEALGRYRGAKGNLVFPLDSPMPMPLIRRVAVALHAAYGGQPLR
jgi:uncharacterized protein YdhG (YjbR/CyaY superfamily)